MGGACSIWGKGEQNACRVIGCKLEGKRPLGRSRCEWEDLKEMDGRAWCYCSKVVR